MSRQSTSVFNNKYNSNSLIIGKPKIGKGTWIGAFTVIDGSGGLVIGKNCDISCGVHVYTHSTHIRCLSNKKFNKDNSINRDLIEKRPVKVGNNTFIGANAVIMMGVNIGDYCIIGAGSVVTKNVPDYSVVGGVPAKIMGKVEFNNDVVKIIKV